MNPRQAFTAVVAAVALAGLVSAGISYAVLRHAGLAYTTPEHVDQIIHDYLTKNPEVLVEMTNELDQRQGANEEAKQKKIVGDNADKIFRSPLSFVAGNPNGDVSLVEFFDYNCGYCRRALPDVVKVVNGDGKVRLVLKELPIFGEDSEAAAKLALASIKQGKYFEVHQKLFLEPGKADKDKALRIAKELGLDLDKLQKDADDPSVKQALDENRDLAQKFSLKGTPLYLIGDQVMPGVPEDLYGELKKDVADIREKGCSTSC